MADLLNLKDVAYGYGESAPVLGRLNFRLAESETVYIRGESGSGKSTFLKILNRLVDPLSGEMEFMGKPYGSVEVTHLRRQVQLVGQSTFLFPVTVLENFQLAAPATNNGRMEELLSAFNLSTEVLSKSGRHLSVGQSARVSVIRSLLMEPKVILLDEPTAALDPDNREIFRNSFDKIRRESKLATVWVTHDWEPSCSEEGRCLTLKKGRFDD